MIIIYIFIGIIFFYAIRCLFALVINNKLDENLYLHWNFYEWIFNPSKLNLWTVKQTKEYIINNGKH